MKVEVTQYLSAELSPESVREIALAVIYKLGGIIPSDSDGGHYMKDGYLWLQDGRHPRDSHEKIRKLTAKDRQIFTLLSSIELMKDEDIANIAI